jgi:hypothetical protein
MQVSQAKGYVGSRCEIVSSDRKGNELRTVADVLDVVYVPMYGACLITDCGEILLDRVRLIMPDQPAAA